MAERLALQRAAEVLDCAAKYAFHSKRSLLSVPDLRLAGGAPGHGDSAAPLPKLLDVPDGGGLLCRVEADVDTAHAVAEARLPTVPLEVGVAPHWLAVEGVQPATVENAQPRRVAGGSSFDTGVPTRSERGGPVPLPAPISADAEQPGGETANVSAALPLKHSLPEELQLYFDVVRRSLQAQGPVHGGAGHVPGRVVAASLATDPGLQPLLPYLVPLLADEVSNNLGDGSRLRIILGALGGLLSNTGLDLLPYIHHLLPAIMTCLVARSLGTGDQHWVIRDEASSLVSLVAQQSHQHKDALAAALARMQQSLAAALLDEQLPTQYGSIVGLTAFGVPVLLSTLIPVLSHYAHLYEEAAQSVDMLQVRKALMVAVGRCMSWKGGVMATGILQSVSPASFQAALQSMAASSQVHL